MDIEQIWSAALGALALVSTHLAGCRRSSAWVVGMAAQAGWLGFIFLTGNFGFLVSFVGFTFVYIRNYIKWTRKPAAPPENGDNAAPAAVETRQRQAGGVAVALRRTPVPSAVIATMMSVGIAVIIATA